mmetsp:Transcript_7168/g.16192  ORF Transcript_7168/g.16192 Transcript_7168/m.16192 type:complete len:114 (+) Transcript_7168:1432-1773(+)
MSSHCWFLFMQELIVKLISMSRVFADCLLAFMRCSRRSRIPMRDDRVRQELSEEGILEVSAFDEFLVDRDGCSIGTEIFRSNRSKTNDSFIFLKISLSSSHFSSSASSEIISS